MQDPSKNDLVLGVFGNWFDDLYVFDHQYIKYDLSFSLSFSVFRFYNTDCISLSSIKLWHYRIGHVPINKLKDLMLVPSHVDNHSLDFIFYMFSIKTK